MLQADHIHFSHKTKEILHNITISCREGAFISIIGPNGAGKSTLLSVLANEFPLRNNQILLKDKSYQDWSSKELPMHKAKFSQQNQSDIPLTVQDIVLMGRYPYFHHNPSNMDLTAIENAMKSTDIWHFKEREYNHLSGGEKQRVHLARVLAQLDNEIDTKILFLDEPLNNLDVLHQHKILNLIRGFTQKGNTAIVVLHDLNLAAYYSDKILLMKNGRKVLFDHPENVLTQETLSEVYNFPCTVCRNPVNNCPLILFGT